MKKVICMECKKKTPYKIKNKLAVTTVKGKEIVYIEKIAICTKCGKEVWVSEVDDYNANAPWYAYSEQFDEKFDFLIY